MKSILHLNAAAATLVACLTLSISSISSASEPLYSNDPVARFAKIEDSPDGALYRSGQIKTASEYANLKKLGVRTIMSFEWKSERVATDKKMAEAAGLKFINQPSYGLYPSDADVDAIQTLMRDPSLRPLLIHCTAGRERTGVFTAIYRVESNGWSPEKAHDEMMNFGFQRSVGFLLERYFWDRMHSEKL